MTSTMDCCVYSMQACLSTAIEGLQNALKVPCAPDMTIGEACVLGNAVRAQLASLEKLYARIGDAQ